MSRARWLITSRSLHKMNSFSLPPTSSYINRNGYISKLQAIILSHAIVHWMLLPWLKMTLPCNQTGSHVHDSLYGHFKNRSNSVMTGGDIKRKHFIFIEITSLSYQSASESWYWSFLIQVFFLRIWFCDAHGWWQGDLHHDDEQNALEEDN